MIFTVKGLTQRAQYPLTKEYTLNHNIKGPYNSILYSLIPFLETPIDPFKAPPPPPRIKGYNSLIWGYVVGFVGMEVGHRASRGRIGF